MISSIVFPCMVNACVFLVILLLLAWVLPAVTMVFNLAFSFTNSHGVMRLSCFVLVVLMDGFEVEWGGLRVNHKAYESLSGIFGKA